MSRNIKVATQDKFFQSWIHLNKIIVELSKVKDLMFLKMCLITQTDLKLYLRKKTFEIIPTNFKNCNFPKICFFWKVILLFHRKYDKFLTSNSELN